MEELNEKFWAMTTDHMMQQLQIPKEGLSKDEAKKRLAAYGFNSLKSIKRTNTFNLLLSQFKSPIILILFFATGLSFFLHETVDALIILFIIFVSSLLGFWQEYSANNAVVKLLAIVQIKASVLRDGKPAKISVEEIVPGDRVLLKAGDVVPGDCLILESNSLFVDEATLTGETFPVEKEAGVLPEDTAMGQRRNTLWMGTHIISGNAQAIIIHTARNTEFGKISERLKLRPQETEFERGVKRFGYYLMEITLILVFAIFAINVFLNRPILDSFLFSLALAVGLTPQLLPAIISINLAHGSKLMAQQKVIVKRLASIENFGSMDVLCSDKTGTLTDGIVRLQSTLDVEGNQSDGVLFFAYMNSYYETGFMNPIDEAIRNHQKFDLDGYLKLGEVPYDFARKRLSILVAEPSQSDPGKGRHILVTKGALLNVLSLCTKAETTGGEIVDISDISSKLQREYEEYSGKGYRTLGIAYKVMDSRSSIEAKDEAGMIFKGFLTLFDPPKPDIMKTIQSLKDLGITLKIITGDNRLIAENVMGQLGLSDVQILTGPELRQISDAALLKRVREVTVFAEVEPNQKERIIIALKKAGFVVGYMGDGINDASALHAADVGISVDSAVDVAKEAADIVLLDKDLDVLVNGVKAGRVTFANTMKYVFMATSANFGNMFSMAGISLFLPFLPLLPKQILLTNLITDFPEMTIATDTVDRELIERPRRWDVGFIRTFMLTFGFISSIFDYLTFVLLMVIVHATDVQFRTGWFIESVVSASLIVLVVRSRKPFFKSIPGKYLTLATLFVVAITVALPYTPFSGLLGFQPLPLWLLCIIGLIVALYIFTAEIAKKLFYKMVKY